MKIRTRIAPSPTGMLHIGTARAALFNYLFARKNNGQFLIRIEDTDLARNTTESYSSIIDGLSWLGMKSDEEIIYQSKRNDFYKKQIDLLINSGKAYYSYTPEEEIEKRKQEAISQNNSRYIHRYSAEDDIITNQKPVIRLKVQPNVNILIDDKVQGQVTINTNTIEDFIICRSDGTPVYMFAVVCDDIDMQISHVIRGVDHLSNTAKQILLYNAFDVNLPVFAHMPLIHGTDGSKLSKRHGAVATVEYKKQGYLPEAMRAYLLRLGWGTNHDNILTDDEAIAEFKLEGIGRSPSQFDVAKLQSVNEYFIKNAGNEYLHGILAVDYGFDFGKIINPIGAINLLKNRSKTLLELQENLMLFKKERPHMQIDSEKLKLLRKFMESCNENDDLHHRFQEFLKANNVKFKDIGPDFRMILIGTASSIAIFEIIAVIGFAEAKKRVCNL